MTTQRATPAELAVMSDRTNSREILARARQQAAARNFDRYFLVDVDSHIGDGAAWPEICVTSRTRPCAMRRRSSAAVPAAAPSSTTRRGCNGRAWADASRTAPA